MSLWARLGRSLDAAVRAWREPIPTPEEIAQEAIKPVPPWQHEITPVAEREQVREYGKQQARIANDLRAEARVIARNHGVELR